MRFGLGSSNATFSAHPSSSVVLSAWVEGYSMTPSMLRPTPTHPFTISNVRCKARKAPSCANAQQTSIQTTISGMPQENALTRLFSIKLCYCTSHLKKITSCCVSNRVHPRQLSACVVQIMFPWQKVNRVASLQDNVVGRKTYDSI